MRYLNDPEGTRLPIKLDTTTNGEFAPIPLAPVHRRATALAHAMADANARRLRMTRRTFLVSACGAATTLLGMNSYALSFGFSTVTLTVGARPSATLGSSTFLVDSVAFANLPSFVLSGGHAVRARLQLSVSDGAPAETVW